MAMSMVVMPTAAAPAVSGAVSWAVSVSEAMSGTATAVTSARAATVPTSVTAAVSSSRAATTDVDHHAAGRRSLYFTGWESLGRAHRGNRGKQRARGEPRHHHSFHSCLSSSLGHRGWPTSRLLVTRFQDLERQRMACAELLN